MNKINNVLVIGLGAIGSIYATRLYNYRQDFIKVLLDEARLEKYQTNGIFFNGIKYHFSYVLPSEVGFKADLIIIATKSNDFFEAVKMIENFVKEDTIILSLLNGISSEPILIDKFGLEKVLYSYYIGHASINKNHNIFYDGVGTLVFGESQNHKLSDNVLRVKDLFDRTNIDYKIPEDMLSAMWLKFVMNVGINQTAAVLNADYKTLQNSIDAKIMLNDLMSEAVEIANKIGVKNTDSFIKETFNLIYSMPKELKPSMLQDVENRKQTEVDIFAGEICRLGKIYGVPTPKNELVLNVIKSIDNKSLFENCFSFKD